MDERGFVCMTIDTMSEQTDISRVTIISTLNLLAQKNILMRIKNGIYKFDDRLI